MHNTLLNIKSCTLCKNNLPLAPLPIIQASSTSKILIAGQAPGIVTHNRGIPFDDKSGDRLRNWLGVNATQFYTPDLFAIVPMGFCYPGKGKSGDLPPLPLCAKTWRAELLDQLKSIELTLIIGKHAVKWHLNTNESVTHLAAQWGTLLAKNHLVLPHPSPRNNIWLKKNSWFEQEAIPQLQQRVKASLTTTQTNLTFIL